VADVNRHDDTTPPAAQGSSAAETPWAGEWGGTDVQFGEQGARLTYGSYLQLEGLLAAQRLESQAHDELLFITIHQVYELWFKQLLHEATAARDAMLDDDADVDQPWWAQHLLQRMHVIERVLVQQIDVLETMTPQDFLEFRQRLAPASGFQSVQFRELEYALGIRDRRYLENYKDDEPARTRLERRLDEPPLPEAFFGLLRERGFDTPALADDGDAAAVEATRARRVAALAGLYADFESHYDLFLLAEALLEMDGQLQLWRQRHVMMVERVIGGRRGTGGSSGASYLKSTLDKRGFPELWDVRTSMSVHHSY
jgi:tryptophan 2,3-dioxygenase